MIKPLVRAVILGWLTLPFLLGGCQTTNELTQTPEWLLFIEAEDVENQGLYSDAITKYQQLIKENPGTRLSTYSHLRIAELQVKLEKWKDADTSYRSFLTFQPKSTLTPFVLYRLLQANHEQSYTGIFFKEREVDRDMAPNRNIILEYKRFLLLFPDSAYLEEVTPFYGAAQETLAESELMVGNYYFDHEQYNAAIGRYMFLLRNYPLFPKNRDVVQRLIEAYRHNNQPDLADEMSRIEAQRFGSQPPTSQSAADLVRPTVDGSTPERSDKAS